MIKQKITLVEMPAVIAGGQQDKYDLYSKFRLPPRALGLLHAILLQAGHKDVVSIAPHLNNSSSQPAKANIKRIKQTDYLLLSAITRTIIQTQQLALQYKKWNSQGKVIVGGPHATFLPDECLEWADVVVRGEGDKTLPELINILEYNEFPRGIKGVSYKKGKQIIHESSRPFLTEEELSGLPIPFYDLQMRQYVGVHTLVTSRGCPYDCSFCSVTSFYGRGYRRRSNETILKELLSYNNQPKKHIFIADDNFGVKLKETKELLRQMISLGLQTRNYSAQLRVEAALDDEFLMLLKQAGVNIVYVGIESINNQTLKQYNKRVDADQNKKAVKKFREAGIWVHGMLIVGGDGDTPETLRETLQWTKSNLDSVQFFTHMLLPGTEFARQMENEGRVLIRDFRYYDGHHVLIKPKNFTALDLQWTILDMYKQFYSVWDIGHILRSPIKKIDLGLRLYGHFSLGLNNMDKDPNMVAYMKELQKFS